MSFITSQGFCCKKNSAVTEVIAGKTGSDKVIVFTLHFPKY